MTSFAPISSTPISDWHSVAGTVTDTSIPVSMRQYDNSPTIISILSSAYASFDLTEFNNEFMSIVWDISTAEGLWLDIWGIKVGVSRTFNYPVDIPWFGFNTSDNYWSTFNDDVFFLAGTTQTYFLSDDAFRLVILTKAFSNINDCSSKTLNKALSLLFAGRGNCYVSDLGGMAIQYNFQFTLKSWEKALIQYADILPRPAGVSVSYVFS